MYVSIARWHFSRVSTIEIECGNSGKDIANSRMFYQIGTLWAPVELPHVMFKWWAKREMEDG